MARKRMEQDGYNQLAFADTGLERKEHVSYMAEVVSDPEFKKDKKRWQCMVKLLPDLWEQERNALCFVQAQHQSALDANRLALMPSDVVKIGGVPTGNQTIELQGGKTLTIQRFSLSHVSVFSRAPRLQPQALPNSTRRLLA